MRFFWQILQVQSGLTAYSREYIGWRLMETEHSLVEILLAGGQLKHFWLWLSLVENILAKNQLKLDFLAETLLAEAQLKLCLAFTIYNREYFCWRPMKTYRSLVGILLAKGQLKLFSTLTIFHREHNCQKGIFPTSPTKWPWLFL